MIVGLLAIAIWLGAGLAAAEPESAGCSTR
jgi:hypothetical protein